MSDPTTRNKRRTLQGTVTSTKMSNTITVLVKRTFQHPKYGKFVRKSKRYHAHDEGEVAKVGDEVEIVAARPMSKLKRWRLVRVVEAALDRGADLETAAAAPDVSVTGAPVAEPEDGGEA